MEWITCENTYEESWRRLLEYANIELAIEAIEGIHGKKTKKTEQNYIKQAEQIRVALLQAKEYFDASQHSSLFTQPNHLYYGAVALSTACMLIRGDGKKSLDYLRGDSKNAHHGLDFSFSSTLKESKQGIKLLENSYTKICEHGHFSNWYSTLIKKQFIEAEYHQQSGRQVHKNMEVIGSYEIPDFDLIKNKKTSLDSLIKRLPDLHSDLIRFDIDVASARGRHKVDTNIDKNTAQHTIFFHSSSSHEILMDIINKFECKEGVNFSIEISDGAINGIIRTRQDKNWSFSLPDSRDTLDHNRIFYKDDISMPEVVDLFMISYALSMMSRYFPDIWVSFLESHCKGAKLVERVVRVLTQKLTTLMLSQIYGRNLIISTHRPIWFL